MLMKISFLFYAFFLKLETEDLNHGCNIKGQYNLRMLIYRNVY